MYANSCTFSQVQAHDGVFRCSGTHKRPQKGIVMANLRGTALLLDFGHEVPFGSSHVFLEQGVHQLDPEACEFLLR